jgi:hypothetical protein
MAVGLEGGGAKEHEVHFTHLPHSLLHSLQRHLHIIARRVLSAVELYNRKDIHVFFAEILRGVFGLSRMVMTTAATQN